MANQPAEAVHLAVDEGSESPLLDMTLADLARESSGTHVATALPALGAPVRHTAIPLAAATFQPKALASTTCILLPTATRKW